MKAIIVALGIMFATVSVAVAQTWTYDPPGLPGMSGSLWNPDGSLGGYYSEPIYPGIDSGVFRTPSGDRYIVDEPLYPGGSTTIRKGF